MYKHILIATDGSALANKALEQGLALAKAIGARALIYTATLPWAAIVSGEMAFAYPVDEYDKAQAEHARSILDKAGAAAKNAGIEATILHGRDSYAAEGIVETAKQRGCDLIVMASHGRRGVSRFLLGSEAQKVVTQSTTPVLIVR